MKDFIIKHPIISFLLADSILVTIRSISRDYTYRCDHSDIKKSINKYSK